VTHLLPFPLMSAFLLATWLLLNQSLSAGQIVLGTVIAIVGGWALSAVEPPRGKLRRPGRILELALSVLTDIFRSNIAVARIILGLATPAGSGFVRIPLDMRSPYGLAALGIIITATPGTVWVDYDSDERILTIHVLDLVDERTWVRTIRHRYERHLLDIFG
jgi:multicomponent K+:H+ antiporter subunit E